MLPKVTSSNTTSFATPANETDSAVPEKETPIGKNGQKPALNWDPQVLGVVGKESVASSVPVPFRPEKTETDPTSLIAV